MTTLKELRSENLSRLNWQDILTVSGEELSQEDMQAMSDYFAKFLPPGNCAMCGHKLAGQTIIDSYLGSFRWGLANGEGICSVCGYPARAYHRNVGPIQFLNMILQYHPDELHSEEDKRRQQRKEKHHETEPKQTQAHADPVARTANGDL